MAASVILAGLAVVFLAAGASRAVRLGVTHPQPRTWLLVGAIFGVVSTWLMVSR